MPIPAGASVFPRLQTPLSCGQQMELLNLEGRVMEGILLILVGFVVGCVVGFIFGKGNGGGE